MLKENIGTNRYTTPYSLFPTIYALNTTSSYFLFTQSQLSSLSPCYILGFLKWYSSCFCSTLEFFWGWKMHDNTNWKVNLHSWKEKIGGMNTMYVERKCFAVAYTFLEIQRDLWQGFLAKGKLILVYDMQKWQFWMPSVLLSHIWGVATSPIALMFLFSFLLCIFFLFGFVALSWSWEWKYHFLFLVMRWFSHIGCWVGECIFEILKYMKKVNSTTTKCYCHMHFSKPSIKKKSIYKTFNNYICYLLNDICQKNNAKKIKHNGPIIQ